MQSTAEPDRDDIRDQIYRNGPDLKSAVLFTKGQQECWIYVMDP